MSKLGDPTDGTDQFQPVVRQAGYGKERERYRALMDWLTRHPSATCRSGEGKLLYDRIQLLETALHEIAAHLGGVAEPECHESYRVAQEALDA